MCSYCCFNQFQKKNRTLIVLLFENFSVLVDISLNPNLQAACDDDIKKFCLSEKSTAAHLPFKSMVLFCLRVQFTKRVKNKIKSRIC